ncbi:hypothetical protein CMEL01_09074 [Colletotrichum melonis]|uniref:Uncharacterized protein n=1 Tax=Colletotrichum melonis TaxID=1209925 RepID=A0AAI9TWH9_9PEZI|nr:hypothetical protein CMEL01_09074 [Colletotrichum melonis]
MESSNGIDDVIQHNDILSGLHDAVRQTGLITGSYLSSFASATAFIFGLAIDLLARDLRGSRELKLEIDSLKRSLKRLQNCQKEYIVPSPPDDGLDEDSDEDESSYGHPEPTDHWRSTKYVVLSRISTILMTKPEGEDSAMEEILRYASSADPFQYGNDHISKITTDLAAATMFLMNLQHEGGYGNPGVEDRFLPVYYRACVDRQPMEYDL